MNKVEKIKYFSLNIGKKLIELLHLMLKNSIIFYVNLLNFNKNT